MLQYLFNLTAIWLCSLLLFDVFLKNESYHQYNRFYLLFTMLMGAMLPLWHWQDPVIYHTPVGQPLYDVMPVQKIVSSTAAQSTYSIGLGQIITIIYLLGAGIALLLLIKDIVVLLRYYHNGHKSKEGKITIVETGKAHGPFSVFNFVFVNSKDRYTDAEWQVLSLHEAKHNAARHIIDLFILQVAKIIFWFHPLIYVYQKRLLLVHEYQADMQPGYEPKEYGKFLIEQALLQSSPVITHSFNRSPIKKRITMLTKRSPGSHKAKLLIALPLTLCCILCFTQSSYSFKHDGKNIVMFRGNKFEFGIDQTDLVSVDPKSGKSTDIAPSVKKVNNSTADTIMISSVSPTAPAAASNTKQNVETFSIVAYGAPLKMNDKPIYTAKKGMLLANPTDKEKTLTDYLFYSLSDDLSQLPDGEYTMDIGYPIIDEKGKLVYYENKGISIYHHMDEPIDKDLEEKMIAAIARALDNAPRLKPTIEDGKAVPSYDAWGFELGKTIVVSNHKVTLTQHKLKNSFN